MVENELTDDVVFLESGFKMIDYVVEQCKKHNQYLILDLHGAPGGQTGANIDDSKLATIATAGKVANSATTATKLNAANAIVARDANGAFSAGIITASLNGNASTATKLAATKTIYGNY